jgi:hypothetical protein
VCALSPVTLFTLNLLRAQGVRTSHWFYEDYRKAPYWKFVLSGYDHFFAIQKGPIPEFCKQNGSAYSFLPTAAATLCCSLQGSPDNCTRNKDVSFIGIPSAYRIETLEYLAQQGISCVIAGLGWDRYNGPLKDSIINSVWTDGNQVDVILKNAKIGINLSVSSPDADRLNTHFSPRVFDVLASGCILLTEDVPLIKDTLQNLRYHTFVNKEEAAKQVANILADYSREKEFLGSNRSIVCREHTYENRVKEIIALCR